MRPRVAVVLAILTVWAGGCSGSTGDSQNSDLPAPSPSPRLEAELAESSAQPLERVPIDGLPEEAEAAELYAEIHPGDGLEELNGSFPGVVYPNDEGTLSLVVPVLATDEPAQLEVVFTDGARRSPAQTLTVEPVDPPEEAFSNAVSALDRAVMTFVERSPFSESELRQKLDGNDEIAQNVLPYALAYHLVSDPDNPKALINREFEPRTRRVLNVFARQSNFEELAELAGQKLPAAMAPRDGGGDENNLGFEPVEVGSAAELSDAMQEYHQLRDTIEDVRLFQQIFGIYVLVVSGPLAVASGQIATVLSTLFHVAGIEMTVYEYMEGTKLGQLPCCIDSVAAELEDGGRELEDEPAPQVELKSVEVEAKSQGMDFSKKTKELLSDLARDAVVTKAAGAASSNAMGRYAKNLDDVDEAAALADVVGSEAAKRGWDAAVEVGDGNKVRYRWRAALHGPRVEGRTGRADGDEWLKTVPLGRESMVEPVSPTALRLKRNAYELEQATIRTQPKVSKFPVGTHATVASTSVVARLRQMSVSIVPKFRSVETGESYEFDVEVRRAHDTKVAEVAVDTGTITEQIDPSESEAEVQTFEWEAPQKASQLPAHFSTRSLSDQGLRGEFGEPGYPPRAAVALAGSSAFVSVPAAPCLESGQSHTFEASVGPADAKLDWTASAGRLEVDEDTQSAVYHAPEGPTRATVTAAQRSSPSIEDEASVVVREDCRCSYRVAFSGYFDEFRETGRRASSDKGILQLVYVESSGSFHLNYGKENGPDMMASANGVPNVGAGGVASFDAPFSYSNSGEFIASTGRARVRLEWVDELDAKVEISGTASACRPPCGGDSNVEVPFQATLRPIVVRSSEDGFKYKGCDGIVHEGKGPGQ